MKNATNLKWLVWKEYRQNWLIVMGTLLLLAIPYLVIPVAVFIFWLRGWISVQEASNWRAGLHSASYFSMCVSQIALLLIGGSVMAGERIDRSVEFQACLPVPRRRILLGKILLVLLMFAIIWLPDLAVFSGTIDLSWRRELINVKLMTWAATVGVTFFCVAWFFSSLLGSPTIAVAIGLVTPFLALTLPWLAMWSHGFEHYAGRYVDTAFGRIPLSQSLLDFWANLICFTVSPICFALGTWLFLRRVEP